MKKMFYLFVFCFIISISVYPQQLIDASDNIGLKYTIKKSGYISVKGETPVYKTKSLSGVIVYEFKRDTTIQPSVISDTYFELGDLGYITPYSYIPNSFYSDVLDSIVSHKLEVSNRIDNIGVGDNTLIKLHQPISFTIDTTYTNYSSQTLRYFGSELLVKKTVGSFYLAYNSKIIDQDIYLKKEHLESLVKESLENSTKNLLPQQISRLNQGKLLTTPTPNWTLISNYKSGGYSSVTYRSGNKYKTVTSYNGKTETSEYTQY